jgi:hypothetical protein
MKMKTLRHATALVFVWYFLISWSTGYSSFTQVGPFKTQSDCKAYKAKISSGADTSSSVVTSCFSTE